MRCVRQTVCEMYIDSFYFIALNGMGTRNMVVFIKQVL